MTFFRQLSARVPFRRKPVAFDVETSPFRGAFLALGSNDIMRGIDDVEPIVFERDKSGNPKICLNQVRKWVPQSPHYAEGTQHNPQTPPFDWRTVGNELPDPRWEAFWDPSKISADLKRKIEAMPQHCFFKPKQPGNWSGFIDGDFSKIEERVRADYCHNDSADALAFALHAVRRIDVEAGYRTARVVGVLFVSVLVVLSVWGVFEFLA